MLWKPIRLPVSSSQTLRRLPMGRIGVRDSHSNSTSILRRERLSTMVTSYPCAERCSEVGQPQKPSPPKTSTFISRAPFLLYVTRILSFEVEPGSGTTASDCSGKCSKGYQPRSPHPVRSSASRPDGPTPGPGPDGSADAILTQINAN